MQKKEIHLALIHYREANYNRPVIIIETSHNLHTVGLISSAMDLYKENYDFLIVSKSIEYNGILL